MESQLKCLKNNVSHISYPKYNGRNSATSNPITFSPVLGTFQQIFFSFYINHVFSDLADRYQEIRLELKFQTVDEYSYIFITIWWTFLDSSTLSTQPFCNMLLYTSKPNHFILEFVLNSLPTIRNARNVIFRIFFIRGNSSGASSVRLQ